MIAIYLYYNSVYFYAYSLHSCIVAYYNLVHAVQCTRTVRYCDTISEEISQNMAMNFQLLQLYVS
jgi:hypothetical protein